MSKRMTRYPSDCKVYVGDLGNNAKKNDLEYAFSSYGTLRSVWIARNPPGFAFVEFEDARDAADAVRGLDGRTICGRRARVELSSGKSASGGRSERRGEHYRGNMGGSGGGGGSGRGEDKCYECGYRGHYARDCKGGRKGRTRRSRSRSASRGHKSYTRSDTRSSSHSHSVVAKRPREIYIKSRENGRNENGGASGRYSDDERNGDTVSLSSRRRYDDSSPSPKHTQSTSSRRHNMTLSRSRSSSRRN